jgi:MYXO-CTERM domain-containing protein
MQLNLCSSIRPRFALACSALCAAMFAHSAQAGLIVDLGGGWEAEIIAAPTDYADVSTDFVDEEKNRIFIQKFWEFLTIDEETGQPEAAHIMFRQTKPDNQTVDRIIINNETIVNHTGMSWTSFHMIVVGNKARFNPNASKKFSVDPFTSLKFTNDDQTANITGGVLPSSNTPWTPGLETGRLVIDVNLNGNNPAKFTLKEFGGSIPAPGALALFGLAGIGRRRRRS